jgi:nucleoside-diphosphate-sugar epimerase
MRVVVTGSVGHLGEALMRALSQDGYEVVGFDLPASPYTGVVGSILDRALVRQCVEGADAVVHTTTLHKPHVGTHDRQAFVDTNISGTLGLLEASAESGVKAFVFTSTTSAFGGALTPPPEAPAVWVTEDLEPAPRNIYGVTKTAAEDLSALLCRDRGLPCIILRTSRFFPELDDWAESRTAFDDLNLKVNELLHRRVDLQDVVSAHRLALERAGERARIRCWVAAAVAGRPERVGTNAVLRFRLESVAPRVGDAGAHVSQRQRQVDHFSFRAEECLTRLRVEHSTISELNLVTGVLSLSDHEQWAQRGEKGPLGKAREALGRSRCLVGGSDGRERGADQDQRTDRGAPSRPVGHRSGA